MQDILSKKTLSDVILDNKTVIVRVDFNVPIKDGVIQDNKRIAAAIPTIEYLIKHNCKIILLSHLSRIKSIDDIKSNKKSLKPIASELAKLINDVNVTFIPTSTGQLVVDAVKLMKPKDVILLENTRYNDVNANGEVVKLESKCDNNLGKE
jgi:phosphoglycerate kinase